MNRAELDQYMTPVWVAEFLRERHFPKLDMADVVLEPSCGDGAFLEIIPPQVSAVGVEIDPLRAQVARDRTSRRIIEGDFRDVPLDIKPTVIIGNPPFDTAVFDGFLERAYDLLPEGAKAGFLLPTYFFQTAGRVAGYSDRWSIAVELMPRNAFSSRMRTPLMFATFLKDRKRTMVGLALYHEADVLTRMATPYKAMLASQQGSKWEAVCRLALQRLGGAAELPAIYAELEGNRPTRTQWWREKVRQTLRVYSDTFKALAPGKYALRVA
jgi:hypothetical protein